MGNNFRDQLLKAGLTNKKQVNKVKCEQHRNRKKNRKNKDEVTVINKTQEKLEAQKRHNHKLNLERIEEERQREKRSQVKDLILANRLALDDHGQPYNFVQQNKIKRIFVSEEMADQLSRGILAIVKLGDAYEVVSAKVAYQISSRMQEAVVVLHTAGKSENINKDR